MAITERTRHDLHLRLDDVLGVEEATTLMEHLPPEAWPTLATKDDLAQLEERLSLRLEGQLHRELRLQTRTLWMGNIASLTAFGSLILAAAKL